MNDSHDTLFAYDTLFADYCGRHICLGKLSSDCKTILQECQLNYIRELGYNCNELTTISCEKVMELIKLYEVYMMDIDVLRKVFKITINLCNNPDYFAPHIDNVERTIQVTDDNHTSTSSTSIVEIGRGYRVVISPKISDEMLDEISNYAANNLNLTYRELEREISNLVN